MPTPAANTKFTWFITGCSTGLGRALAQSVLRRGHRCVVTARNANQIADIVAPFAVVGDRPRVGREGRPPAARRACARRRPIRRRRCARQQRGPRVFGGRRGGRGCSDPRDVRYQFFRARRDDARRAPRDAGAGTRTHHQHFVDRRPGGQSRVGLLQRNQICRRRPVASACEGGRTARDSGDDH